MEALPASVALEELAVEEGTELDTWPDSLTAWSKVEMMASYSGALGGAQTASLVLCCWWRLVVGRWVLVASVVPLKLVVCCWSTLVVLL